MAPERPRDPASRGRVRFLFFYRAPIPDLRAGAIQIVNTCAGIAHGGGEVTLHVETIESGSVNDCLAFYGIKALPAEGAGGLELVSLGRRWSGPLFHWKRSSVLKRAAGSPACVVVREVRPYVPRLIARARSYGLKVVFEAHNVSSALVKEKRDKAFGAAARRLRRKAATRAAQEESIIRAVDGLVCTQNATLEALKHLLRPGALATVLGNGSLLPPPQAVEARDIDVLYCGSLKRWKGVDTLIAAMKGLEPYRLTIVGPEVENDAERLWQVARAAGVADRVTIRPAVPPAQVWAFYARAKVGAIPLPGASFIEAREYTTPLKLFEMLAAGLPVVASHLASITEYVTDGREASLVTPDDPRSLAEGLRKLLENDELRGSLARAGRARAAEFTWDARGRKMVAFAAELFR